MRGAKQLALTIGILLAASSTLCAQSRVPWVTDWQEASQLAQRQEQHVARRVLRVPSAAIDHVRDVKELERGGRGHRQLSLGQHLGVEQLDHPVNHVRQMVEQQFAGQGGGQDGPGEQSQIETDR